MVDKIGNMARDRGLSMHAAEGKMSQLNRKLTKMTTRLFQQIHDREKMVGGDDQENFFESQADLLRI